MSPVSAVERMLQTVRDHARDCGAQTGRPALDPRVLQALSRVPRERFVPPELRAMAHNDSPPRPGDRVMTAMTDRLDRLP